MTAIADDPRQWICPMTAEDEAAMEALAARIRASQELGFGESPKFALPPYGEEAQD